MTHAQTVQRMDDPLVVENPEDADVEVAPLNIRSLRNSGYFFSYRLSAFCPTSAP